MFNFFTKYKIIFYLTNFILILLYLFPGSLIGCFLYDDCMLQPQITPAKFPNKSEYSKLLSGINL